ncbi:MAG: M23 family metallopeptidase [Clostridia bacterium]
MNDGRIFLRKWWARARAFGQKRGFAIALAGCLLMLGGALVMARQRVLPAPPKPHATPAPLPAAHSLDQRFSEVARQVTLDWPVSGREVLIAHSPDQPIWSDTLRQYTVHAGVDIACARGEAVLCALDGTVTATQRDPLLGCTVTVSHAEHTFTRYANLSSLNLVEVGQSIRRGDVLGAVGESAAAESAMPSHLHFEAYHDGAWLALPSESARTPRR